MLIVKPTTMRNRHTLGCKQRSYILFLSLYAWRQSFSIVCSLSWMLLHQRCYTELTSHTDNLKSINVSHFPFSITYKCSRSPLSHFLVYTSSRTWVARFKDCQGQKRRSWMCATGTQEHSRGSFWGRLQIKTLLRKSIRISVQLIKCWCSKKSYDNPNLLTGI